MAKASAAPIKPQGEDQAQKIIKWWSDMDGKIGVFRTTWDDLGRYCMPRKQHINHTVAPGDASEEIDLYNTTAVEGVQIHAAGEKDYMFGEDWFAYAPADLDPDEDAKEWFKKCTEIAVDQLNASNFGVEVHEFLLDRVGFGTAPLFCEESDDMEDSILRFESVRVGSFVCAEGRNKIVNTFLRLMPLTVRQAVEQFGLDNCSQKVKDLWNSGDMLKRDTSIDFIHAIYPRDADDRKKGAMDGPNKKIASVYVDKDSVHVCRNSGYDEMPVAVSRYLKWGKEPYGYCPCMLVLPTAKQNNFIERCMDALAETKAFPRVRIPSNLDGNDIDFRATGQTVYDENRPDSKPEAWLTEGEYDIGLDRIKAKDDLIKRLLLVDFFQMLNGIDREMTAYEVSQRIAEKVSNISPAFSRMQTEFFNPMLRRVFSILMRAGKFPPPPPSIIKATPEGAEIEIPKVILTSKLAMAIKAKASNGFQQWVAAMIPVAQIMGSEVLDAVNFEKAARGMALNSSIPADWMRSEADVKSMQSARAQAAQQAAAVEAAPKVASAAKDLSQAGPAAQKAFNIGGGGA